MLLLICYVLFHLLSRSFIVNISHYGSNIYINIIINMYISKVIDFIIKSKSFHKLLNSGKQEAEAGLKTHNY